MAEEKTALKTVKTVRKVEKKEKPTGFARVLDFFRRLPKTIALPFKNMGRELRKVTWPTRQDLINYTLIVLAFMAFMGVVIGLLDIGSSGLIALLVQWAG